MFTIVKRPRVFYGWYLVAGLSLTEIVSWGALVYSFTAFIVPMHESLGWSSAELNAGYALGAVTSGAVALPFGRWLELHGARALMTIGSLLGVAMLVAWSDLSSLVAFYGVFVLGGVAMGASLYEPAFAVTAAWFEHKRASAVLVLTVFGGLASVIFIPLCGLLITTLGWRHALLVLALIVALVCVPVHALVLRNRPEDLGLRRDGGSLALSVKAPERLSPQQRKVARRAVMKSRSYRLFVTCLVLVTIGKIAVTVNLVAYLSTRGISLELATVVSGAMGIAQIAGRVLVVGLRRRVGETTSVPVLLAAQGASLFLLAFTSGKTSGAFLAIAVFAAVFGLGVGLPELLRGTVIAANYGSDIYASINGSLSLFVVSSRAAGPLLVGLVATLVGGFTPVIVAGAIVIMASAVALVAANRAYLEESRAKRFASSIDVARA